VSNSQATSDKHSQASKDANLPPVSYHCHRHFLLHTIPSTATVVQAGPPLYCPACLALQALELRERRDQQLARRLVRESKGELASAPEVLRQKSNEINGERRLC
jgi:hypothetical protein